MTDTFEVYEGDELLLRVQGPPPLEFEVFSPYLISLPLRHRETGLLYLRPSDEDPHSLDQVIVRADDPSYLDHLEFWFRRSGFRVVRG